MERKLAQPGFWVAALLVLLVLAIQVMLTVPVCIVDAVCVHLLRLPSPQLERQPLVVGFINILACGGAIALGLFLNRLPFRRAFPIGRVTPGQALGLTLTVVGASLLLSEADNAFRALLPPPRWLLAALNDLFYSQNRLLSRVFLLVIVAPVTEELLFRGIILRGLLNRHRPAMAVTLTALLFAALHVNPWQLLSAFFLGVAFGWIYWRTGSILLCVLGHAIANGLSILVPLLPVDIPGLTGTPDYATVEFQPWWLDCAGLIVLLIGLWLFCRATPPAKVQEAPQPPPLPTR